jgi:hypothetical protein
MGQPASASNDQHGDRALRVGKQRHVKLACDIRDDIDAGADID